MKTKKRIASILLTLCMLGGTIGTQTIGVSASTESTTNKGDIKFAGYVDTAFVSEPMLQWTQVEWAKKYDINIYNENGELVALSGAYTNYITASEALPYSGTFYFTVYATNEETRQVSNGYQSDPFTYTDVTAPVVEWVTGNTVRSSDSEATVRFYNKDNSNACTYYYAVVESGAAAPTIDTGGAGVAAEGGLGNYIHLTNLTSGAKDIYLVLKDRDGNVSDPIVTTIPAYVPDDTVRITPSADNGTYDSSSNTLTVGGGGTVAFTAGGDVTFSEVQGTRQPNGEEEMEEEIEDPIVNATYIGTKWYVTLPNEDATYIFRGYYSVAVESGTATEAAECTVITTYKEYTAIVDNTFHITNRDDIAQGSISNVDMTENGQSTDLVIAPGYIDSTSDFKVTTGQGLGVTYSNDALKDVLASVNNGSNVKVATKLEKAELTRDEAEIIVAEWAEIVNTAEGEEQIKSLLENYSHYELALLRQAVTIVVPDGEDREKLKTWVNDKYIEKRDEARAKDNEEPLAKFSVNTYSVAADGTQTYIPVGKAMQYSIPVDTSSIPENATLSLYRINEDGTRTAQEILSVEDDYVLAQTGGNSDYILVYTVNEEHTHDFEWVIDKEATEAEDGIKHEECACGAKQNENTVIPKTGTDDLVPETDDLVSETDGLVPEPEAPDGLSTGAIVAIVIACVAVLAGGGFALYWFVFRKRKEAT